MVSLVSYKSPVFLLQRGKTVSSKDVDRHDVHRLSLIGNALTFIVYMCLVVIISCSNSSPVLTSEVFVGFFILYQPGGPFTFFFKILEL